MFQMIYLCRKITNNCQQYITLFGTWALRWLINCIKSYSQIPIKYVWSLDGIGIPIYTPKMPKMAAKPENLLFFTI